MTDPTGFERTPPHDITAEQAALGGMLLSPDAITDVTDILTTADFYQPANAIVFDTITALVAAGQPADAVTVAAHLHNSGELAKLPSTVYLAELIASVPTAANAAWYAARIAELAAKRRLIEIGTRIVADGYNPSVDADTAIERAQSGVHAATVDGSSQQAATWDTLSLTALDDIEAAAPTEDGLRGLSTGLIDLDRLTLGFQTGQLIVVAGRPGAGKSVCVVDICRSAAFRQRRGVALFSLEMGRSEIARRIVSAESGVPLSVLMSGELDDPQLTAVTNALARTSGAPLTIDDTPGLTLATIRSRARRLQQRGGLGLVAIDYLQLMTTARRPENRQQEVSEISRGLKQLAKELNCPVIAAAQLNRGPEQRSDKRPLLADLRESGSVEQDADIVILLHREDYYDKKSPRAGEIDLIVAKHRNGATDTITAAAQLHRSRFVDIAI